MSISTRGDLTFPAGTDISEALRARAGINPPEADLWTHALDHVLLRIGWQIDRIAHLPPGEF